MVLCIRAIVHYIIKSICYNLFAKMQIGGVTPRVTELHNQKMPPAPCAKRPARDCSLLKQKDRLAAVSPKSEQAN